MTMRWQDRITVTPRVRRGKPCIRGTRITVYERFTYRGGVIRIFGAGYWRKGKRIYERENQVHR